MKDKTRIYCYMNGYKNIAWEDLKKLLPTAAPQLRDLIRSNNTKPFTLNGIEVLEVLRLDEVKSAWVK